MIPAYSNPIDIYKKLLREARRTWFAKDDIETADHFFNFCVTCVSLRDWVVKHKGMSSQQKDTYYKTWRKTGYFGVCADIANSSKHFGLDFEKKSSVTDIDLYIEKLVATVSNGVVVPGTETDKPSFKITIDNNAEVDLFGILIRSCKDWDDQLKSLAITDDRMPNFIAAFVEYM